MMKYVMNPNPRAKKVTKTWKHYFDKLMLTHYKLCKIKVNIAYIIYSIISMHSCCTYSTVFKCCLLWRCRGIGCDRSTLTLRVRVRIPLSPGTFVLQQDTLSTLLLSTQVLNGDPVGGRMRTKLWLSWHCACL